MSLGMELGLGPVDFVLDGDPARPSPKGGGRAPKYFKMPLSMEVGLSPGDFVLG